MNINLTVYKIEDEKWKIRDNWILNNDGECPIPEPSDFVRDNYFSDDWNPVCNWSQGGPIIEREMIQIKPIIEDNCWLATNKNGNCNVKGSTPLEAAMLCHITQ